MSRALVFEIRPRRSQSDTCCSDVPGSLARALRDNPISLRTSRSSAPGQARLADDDIADCPMQARDVLNAAASLALFLRARGVGGGDKPGEPG